MTSHRRPWLGAAAVAMLAVTACGSSGSTDAGDEATAPSSVVASSTAPSATDPAASATSTTPPPSTTVPATTAEAPTEPAYEVDVTRDVMFGSGQLRDGQKPLLADVFVPVEAPGPHPVYLHIPGGGFQEADHANSGPAPALAERGFVTMSIDYRVQGDDPIPSERVGGIHDAVGGAEGSGLARAIAAAVEDSLLGLEWLLAQADEFDLDLDRVAIGGGSAGAITANHIAYTADDFGFERPPVRATVDLWGGFTLAPPADAVQGDEPPVFIVHGTDDNVVPYSFTEDLVAAADAVGLPYELYPVEGAGHGVDITSTTADDGVVIFEHLVRWLDDTLSPEG